ncbi:transcriptional regulator GlxA family with amidase domain [Paraburkholderia sp. GAS348]
MGAEMRTRGKLIERSMDTKHIALVTVPPVVELDVFGPANTFDIASKLVAGSALAPPDKPPYRFTIVSPTDDHVVEGETGCRLFADKCFTEVEGDIDTLLVTAGPRSIGYEGTPEFWEWLRQTSGRARRTGSVCVGAFILAKSGLLEGRRAATHWNWVNDLQTLHPGVKVDTESIWVEDRGVYTSAGVTAGIDLALAMVAEDFGNAVALSVARQMVVFLKRPGGQRQFSVTLAAQAPSSKTFEELSVWIVENLHNPLSVEILAEHMAMSPRHFARVFSAEFGSTPANFVRQSRIQAARTLLEQSKRGMDDIAACCGFGSDEVMRKAFLDVLGVTPGQYRATFGVHSREADHAS